MKLTNFFLFFIFISINLSFADINKEFENWKLNFKKIALENNISEKTFDIVMSDTKFLSDVIKYDRYQPEFYEDTKTYISKRTSLKKVSLGIKFYQKNSGVRHADDLLYLFPFKLMPNALKTKSDKLKKYNIQHTVAETEKSVLQVTLLVGSRCDFMGGFGDFFSVFWG